MQKLFALSVAFFLNQFAQATMVYIPQSFDPKTARMVVAIHGCSQSAESMALGSGWNNLAERHNLVILYPQAPRETHPQDCWRYWLPENQMAQSGDLLELHEEIVAWKADLQMDVAPVFLTGISSGAAMVASLLACYPNDFVAAMMHSGVSYGLATTQDAALKVQSKGPEASEVRDRPCDPRRFQGAVMVVQGDRDRVIHGDHPERIIKDFIGPTHMSTSSGEENGSSFATTDFRVGGVLRGRIVRVKKLAHAWSGFNLALRMPKEQQPWSLRALPARIMNYGEYATTTVPFFSNQGPSATQLAFEFFESTSRNCNVDLQ